MLPPKWWKIILCTCEKKNSRSAVNQKARRAKSIKLWFTWSSCKHLSTSKQKNPSKPLPYIPGYKWGSVLSVGSAIRSILSSKKQDGVPSCYHTYSVTLSWIRIYIFLHWQHPHLCFWTCVLRAVLKHVPSWNIFQIRDGSQIRLQLWPHNLRPATT